MALAELERPPIEDRGFAQVDVHRAVRHGLPEVIFGSGKMVITGARHKDEILEAVQFIQDELADLLY